MTLRKQLTRSYTLVALAGLLLASLVGALLIRNEQIRAAERSVALITSIVTARVEADALQPNDPQLERVVEAAGGRVLLVNAPSGEVRSDSVEGASSLAGQELPVRTLLAAAREMQRPAIRQARLGGDTYFFSIVPVRPLSDRDRLVIAIPTATVLQSWMTLLPGILLMSGLGALLAGAVGYRMSRKVTEPLEALNKAANDMAAGDYDARVSTASDVQELQALSTTFNTMADEVKSARQVQRDFLANVSHDLRTPLTSIQGFSQAMMDGAVPENQLHRVATIIYTEAGRLSRLVLDLLDLARIEAGRFAMNRRDLNFKDILSQVKETFEPQAERAGVTLDFKLPRRALPLYADSDRLVQVFSNLLDNAITYAQQGGKTVKVTAELGGIRNLRSYATKESQNGHGTATPTTPAPEPVPAVAEFLAATTAPRPAITAKAEGGSMTDALTGTATVTSKGSNGNGNGNGNGSEHNHSNGARDAGSPASPVTTATQDEPAANAEGEDKIGRWWVEVKISDDGPGIAYDQKARVFERFHRGDAARGGGGMGLGLAIAKEIVEAHGGDIAVQDNAKQGTVFVIRLPMKMW
jgi:signal transduction histidine kinase